ncbi:MAG: hypothetical protein V1717_02725 [Candidatus Micrarchaeota archaeon]
MRLSVLKTQKDVSSVKKGDFVDSENASLLEKVAGRKVFVNPLRVKNFHKSEALVKSVAEGESVFAIPLSFLLQAKGAARAKLLKDLKAFFRLCYKMKAKFVFTNAFAQSKFDLKSKREAKAIGSLFTLTPLQAKKAFGMGGEEEQCLSEHKK